MIRQLLLALSFTVSAAAADIAWLKDEVVNQARQAVVSVITAPKSGIGGFFVSEEGWVVTRASPLEGLSAVAIDIPGEPRIEDVPVLVLDAEHDLALLATGTKPRAYLKIRDANAKFGDPCVLFSFDADRSCKATDGLLLCCKRMLDWTEAHFQDLWSVLTPPSVSSFVGAPVVTADGSVIAIVNFFGGIGAQHRNFAVPGDAILKLVERGKEAKKPVPIPKPGAIARYRAPTMDLDYIAGAQLFTSNDMSGARARFEVALTRHADSPILLGQLAQACRMTGDHAAEEKFVREGIMLAPDRVYAHMHLGLIMMDRGDEAAALRLYEEMTQRLPDLGSAWGSFSKRLASTGRKEEALNAARKWTELEPDHTGAWENYADALSVTGNFAEASRAKAKAADLDSFAFKVHYTAPKRE